MPPVRDIANNMKFGDYCLAICNHYCHKRTVKTDFFDWLTYFDGKFIKTMCVSCALREAWGYSYKQNKHYKKWIN